MSHLKEADRKTINSMLAHGNKCCEIAEAVGCDPTTIAKEIKRNRIVSKDASKGRNKILCKKLDRWPYVCGTCCTSQEKVDTSGTPFSHTPYLFCTMAGSLGLQYLSLYWTGVR